MKEINLDKPIVEFGNDSTMKPWTLRQAFQGTLICGALGAGKTSGVGRVLALKLLSEGYGFLILTAKPDEKQLWEQYCVETGRSNDLVVIEPRGNYLFNFLEYLATSSHDSEAVTDHIVDVLKTVLRAGEEKSSGKNDDQFWESALDQLLFNVVDLCRLANDTVSIESLFEIVQTLPRPGVNETAKDETTEKRAFRKAFETASNKVKQSIARWDRKLSSEKKRELKEQSDYFTAMYEAVPEAKMLMRLDNFFFDSFKELSPKTRAIIEFSFSGLLMRLLREPFYSLFCKGKSNFLPEDTFAKNKVVIINLPVKTYHKAGQDIQILVKYLWQLAMEKRVIIPSSLPCVLWCDECTLFSHERDAEFQATARSSRIATVYLTQNINQFFATSGPKSEYRVKGFLGTISTKFFLSNADWESNKYASDLIGDGVFYDHTSSITIAGKPTQTEGQSIKIEKHVRPEEFMSLKTGGPNNNFLVEAYIHCQGDPQFKGLNFSKVTFSQKYKSTINNN
jgi:type IV secretory pathway TraG/TraD family ATPase VirD4